MAILANRVRTKNSLVQLSKFILVFSRKCSSGALIGISCFLLYFSYPKAISTIILDSVGRTLSFGTILYDQSVRGVKSIYSMVSYFQDLQTENLKLRLEINSLQHANEQISFLKEENLALREMLNVPISSPAKFVTAKIVGTAISPFANTATIQAGTNDNIKVNDIVKGSKGLIGRITEVGHNYSNVMLINDHNSRIPITTGNSKVHGILAKQEDNLKVIYLQENHNAMVGEIIYTSGEGKIFPKGIPIATIVDIKDKDAFVEVLDNLNKLDFVMVISSRD